MGNFIGNTILWTLAFYGLFEIMKTVVNIFTYTNLQSDGIYVIVAIKNQENKIEGFLRSFLFRILYGKEETMQNIIITDLDSQDKTLTIIKNLQKEHEEIKVMNWRECKELIESIKNT